MRLHRLICGVAAALVLASAAGAAPLSQTKAGQVAVTVSPTPGAAPLILAGRAAQVLSDPGDFPGVLRAAHDLQGDLRRVAGAPTDVPTSVQAQRGPTVIVGSLGRSAVIDRLVREGRLDVSGVRGRWEAFVQQVVEHPLPGVDRAVVIAGADKRGAIFGAYDLSQRIGVSPWSWWADVPVRVKPDLWAAAGRRADKPVVRYRGIFLNDEAPALQSWADGTFGGFNHAFYGRVFELILRLKGNFLWPAMWGKSFFDDDPLNASLADEYGVVIGTSHHEPMMRAQAEWARYGHGPWDYSRNAAALQDFWRKGMERRGSAESLVTIGMRGDGDEPMTSGVATALLERIVADQRRIIGEVTGKAPAETPQVWALYKEVQDYYDQGMRVPDDVTLLFSDDNWGNLRRLPKPDAKRAGGYGVYYHFDYVGDPRNYKWLNTVEIARTWEQMRLAHAYGADRLWIVNVGDLKPLELPTSFFLDYAWNPDACAVDCMAGYTRRWAAEQFGDAHAAEIAALLQGYTSINARRKPELLSPQTWSLTDNRDAERAVAEWDDLETRADKLAAQLPSSDQDAFFELVRFPIQASANLTRLYLAAARNRLYAEQGRASANLWADEARRLFARDADLTRRFHEDLAGGKWRGMMSQTHIGYTGWQQPDRNIMPELRSVQASAAVRFGVSVEGDPRAWPAGAKGAVLPSLDRDGVQSRWIDVFGSGDRGLGFRVDAAEPWVRVRPGRTGLGGDQRFEVSVDWTRAPLGRRHIPITVSDQGGRSLVVDLPVSNATLAGAGFREADGRIVIDAVHAAIVHDSGTVRWQVIPGLGRAGAAVEAWPAVAPPSPPGPGGAYLQYDLQMTQAGPIQLQVATAPTLDFRSGGGLRFAVSLDEGPAQVLRLGPDQGPSWARAVSADSYVATAALQIGAPGHHRLRLWRIDPGVAFEQVVLTRTPLPFSELGPVESRRLGSPDPSTDGLLRPLDPAGGDR